MMFKSLKGVRMKKRVPLQCFCKEKKNTRNIKTFLEGVVINARIFAFPGEPRNLTPARSEG